MSLLGRLARLSIVLKDKVTEKVRTASAQQSSIVGPNTIVKPSGSVINISRNRDSLEVGANCVIAGQLLVFAHGGRIKIGDWVFVGEGAHVWSSCELHIGNRVLISHNVEIHDTESHPLDPVARFEQTRSVFTRGHPKEIEGIRAAPIRIGDDVWIGFGATIRKGVSIGDRAIIGARAIIDKDVPADGLVKAEATN